MTRLTLSPIGTISSPYTERYQAPRQPGIAAIGVEGIITLEAGRNFEQALADLEGFEWIWVIYWFDRNETWRPKVLPPRGRTRRGLFATRSPHRPNPLGLSLLRLIEVRGRTIRVADVDLLDGTPILDIKPYIPSVEAHPHAHTGWLEEVEESGGYSVELSERAEVQTAWLREEYGIDLVGHARSVLARDPAPHPYRRVTRRDDGSLELAITSWRIHFSVEEDCVTIERVASGYDAAAISVAEPGSLHHDAAHRAFAERWG